MGNYIFAYYQTILDGTEVVGRWILLLYKRIVGGIEAGEYIFDEGKANNAIRFIFIFSHCTTEMSGNKSIVRISSM